jgi:cob(I)alamin adenosyltransferase
MRFYSGKGDQGTTDLLGDRVSKNDPIVELLGALDEASSGIGLGRATAMSCRLSGWLIEFQRDLYQVMAEIAFTDEIRPSAYRLSEVDTARLEAATDALGAEIVLPPHFILPGDTHAGATLDLARTVVRRAERRAVDLLEGGRLSNAEIVRYLNRLSSFLFIAARYEDHLAGVTPTKAKQD